MAVKEDEDEDNIKTYTVIPSTSGMNATCVCVNLTQD